jgi:hypothetical protein
VEQEKADLIQRLFLVCTEQEKMNDDEQFFEGAEVVAEAIRESSHTLARAITPVDALGGHDATGGYVRSLTEAVMGNTAALMAIAAALESIAQAIRLHD